MDFLVEQGVKQKPVALNPELVAKHNAWVKANSDGKRTILLNDIADIQEVLAYVVRKMGNVKCKVAESQGVPVKQMAKDIIKRYKELKELQIEEFNKAYK